MDTIVMWVMVSHVDADTLSCCFINAVCGVIQSLRQPVGYKAGVIIGQYLLNLVPFDLKVLDGLRTWLGDIISELNQFDHVRLSE